MSVVVGVKKGGRVAIAADTLTSQGDLLLPGESKSSPDKIQKLAGGYIGLVGSSAHHQVLRSLGQHHAAQFDFSGEQAIFETFRGLQKRLVEEYHVRPDEDDDTQEYDSNQLFGIIISRAGLFAFQSYREVTEMETFWAAGSGAELAIGALAALYDTERGARAVAVDAVRIACRYEKSCGLPVTVRTLALRD